MCVHGDWIQIAWYDTVKTDPSELVVIEYGPVDDGPFRVPSFQTFESMLWGRA